MSNSKTKQVIVMRKDLKMRRGKEMAQASHASMMFILKNEKLTDVQREWVGSTFAKICVTVDSEEELLEIYNKAQSENLEVHLIKDSGFTEFKGVPTLTCLAIGPDYSDKIDKVTGHLKLY